LAKFKGLIGVNSSEVYKRESRLLVFQREIIIFSQRERGILSFEENTFFDKLVCTL